MKKIFAINHFLIHETKRKALIKFLLVFLVFVSYFLFLVFRYGAGNGILITILTWSFFVLCTPIADAGFLLDFPLRLITGIRMFYSEIIVWTIAINANLYFFFSNPSAYEKTFLLKIFKHILEKPWPFWGIIFLSFIGTFLSIYFGDELIDKVTHSEREKHQKHKFKHQFVIFIFLIGFTIFLYNYLLTKLNLKLF